MIKGGRICAVLGLVAFAFSSCEKAIVDSGFDSSRVENFEYLHREVKEHYAFFELKNVDWDSVYNVYRPQVNNGLDEIAFFNICGEMLNTLEDGHVNLTSPFNISRYNISNDAQENFNFRLIEDNYLSDDYFITGPFINDFIEGTNVGYVRYSSFTSEIVASDLDFVTGRFRNADGLILDLRNNGGGSLNYMQLLAGMFIQDDLPYIYHSTKIGPNANDFSQEIKVDFSRRVVNPYTKLVVLLVNRNSYSATSFFTVVARQLDNVTVVGDTTGGGLGVPTGGELPNGWDYRFSGTITLTPERENFENGVPPDEYVIMDKTEENAGVDSMLERALEILNN